MIRTTTTTSFSFAMATAAVAVAFLLLLSVPGGSLEDAVKKTSSTLPPKNNTTGGNTTCASDSDCNSTTGHFYCNLKSKLCTCQLFYRLNGTACLPVVCKKQFDCKTAEKEKDPSVGFFYSCDKDGKCQCRMPRVLSKNGAACENPLWADIVGWSALGMAACCVLVCCYCVMFGFDKKQQAAGGGGGSGAASKRSSTTTSKAGG